MSSASRDQLKLVGLACPGYDSESLTSASDSEKGRSCETCTNWDGEKCVINYFDKVLTGLDQT
jgi:hypothetical protein